MVDAVREALSRVLPLQFHPVGPVDVLAAFACIYLVVLSLVAPPAPSWRLIRAGIVTPVVSVGFAYFGFFPVFGSYEEQWGTLVITAYCIINTLEMLVFFPAEEYSYRVRPRSPAKVVLPPKTVAAIKGTEQANGHATVSKSYKAEWVVEAVPAPWTWEKFWWANSLFWNMRGIGWNFAPPLPSSSLKPPYTPGSSRRQFVWTRLRTYVIQWIILDMIRSWMNLSPAAAFFSGRPGAPNYSELTQVQRAIYSVCVVTRIVLGMDRSHIPCGIVFVTIGGVMGWDTEICSPWGWPPLFGSFGEVWRHPGLSQMWSRTWHHYFRTWLWKFGWVGLGETILRLPPSGPSLKAPPALVTPNSPYPTPGASPAPSGRVSPSHPLPTVPNRKPSSVKLNDLIKSFCVFALSGWIHDHAAYFLMYHTSPGVVGSQKWQWTDAIVTMPFFLIQPCGLALEAAVKSRWRGWKGTRHAEWKKNGEPDWLVFVERLVGFVWTWTWLGWTAGWFIQGVTRMGYYRRGQGQKDFPSLFGGLIWGKWKH